MPSGVGGAGSGAGSSRGSSPWLREVNPLNLSVASDSGEEGAAEMDLNGSGRDSQHKLTAMQIASKNSAKSGGDSVSVRLPTRDEDDDEQDEDNP